MKICITGKPGSGKSLAMEYIQKAGYRTFIADDFVHAIYKAGQPGYLAIKKAFGSKFVSKTEVNRKALGQLVFGNKNALKKLNNLINPIIKKAIIDLDNSQKWFIELATYIFYPKTFAKIFDKVVLISAPEKRKNKIQKEKFSYLKKIPTFFVDNSKKSSTSILYIGNRYCKAPLINVDIFVNNDQSKKILQKNILKICEI